MIKNHPKQHGAGVPAGEVVIVHHWAQGPQDVVPVPPFTAMLGGRRQAYNWKFYFFLDRVQGTSRTSAIRAIYAVLRNAQSWERTGVRWVRTMSRQKANILVSVIPETNTYCGVNAAGCYCANCEAGATAELGVEYLGSNQFAELVNMELCGHGTFRMHDMYIGEGHVGYEGVMGTWDSAAKTAYYPTDNEIEWAKEWLLGKAQYVHSH